MAKLAAADGSLVWSTYLGGGSLRDEAADIVVDGNGRAIVVGTTASAISPPPRPSAATPTCATRSSPASPRTAPAWSSPATMAPSNTKPAVAVDVDEANDIYVGVFGRDHEIQYYSNEILKIDEYAKTLTWTHTLGFDYEGLYLDDIAVSDDGEVAFAGTANGNQVAAALVNPWQAAPGGQDDFFAGKLNSAGNAILWSTYLGGASGRRQRFDRPHQRREGVDRRRHRLVRLPAARFAFSRTAAWSASFRPTARSCSSAPGSATGATPRCTASPSPRAACR